MLSFAFDALSPDAVRRGLDTVDLEEKTKLAEDLALIALMDARGEYLEAGYSCVQKHCMGRLGMSEDRASKRITVARVGRRFVGLLERIADGRLSVSVVLEIAPRLCDASAPGLLADAEHRSRGDVLRILARRGRVAQAASSAAPPCTAPAPESVSASAPGFSALRPARA